ALPCLFARARALRWTRSWRLCPRRPGRPRAFSIPAPTTGTPQRAPRRPPSCESRHPSDALVSLVQERLGGRVLPAVDRHDANAIDAPVCREDVFCGERGVSHVERIAHPSALFVANLDGRRFLYKDAALGEMFDRLISGD